LLPRKLNCSYCIIYKNYYFECKQGYGGGGSSDISLGESREIIIEGASCPATFHTQGSRHFDGS
jgi:hypothetical protein